MFQSTRGIGAFRVLTDLHNNRSSSTSASPSTGRGIVAQHEGINVHADTVAVTATLQMKNQTNRKAQSFPGASCSPNCSLGSSSMLGCTGLFMERPVHGRAYRDPDFQSPRSPICPKCNGQMKILDAVTKNENVKIILNSLTDQNPRDGPLTAQLLMNI